MTLPASTIQTFILFLLMSAGFAAGKTSILDEMTVKKLSRFLVNFVLPCLIVASMQQPLTPELRMEAFRTLGLSFAIYASSFPLAFGFASLIRAKGPTRGVHAFAAVFANVAFMGFPVQQALFGKAVLFQASIFIIPFNLLAFSVGAAMIAGGVRSEGREPTVGGGAVHEAKLSWRSFVNPAGVSSIVGFALFLADFRLPLPLFRAMSILGDTTTPLAMCIIGATLAETNLGNTLRDWRLWASSAFRLLALPLLLYLVLKTLGFTGIALGMPVMMAAMPVAANLSFLSAAFGGDYRTASSLVFLSTAISLVSIPLLAAGLFGI
jgi:hypothetical protein